MEARQSPLTVRLVEALFPPACREEVIGDLHERATSAGGFLLDALAALPLVVWSRVRRTSEPWGLAAEGWGGLLAFRFAAGDGPGWLALSIPAAAAVVAMMLRDAYARPGPRPKAAFALDAVFGAAAAAVAASIEVALASGGSPLALPSLVVGAGCAFTFPILAVLRIWLHHNHRARVATTTGGMADPAVLRRGSERWWNLFWSTGVLYVATLALATFGRFPAGVNAAALLLAVIAAVAVHAWTMHTWNDLPRPAGNDTLAGVSAYVLALERRRDRMRCWPRYAFYGLAALCGFPFVGGLLIRLTDVLSRIDTPPVFDPLNAWPAWAPIAGISVAWLVVGTALSKKTARAIQDEIDALERAADDE